MKNDLYSALYAALLLGCVMTLTGCSDDKPAESGKASSAGVTSNASSPAATKPVKEADKLKFENEFSEECVKREVDHADDKEAAKKFAAEPCACIAKYLSKDLSAVEMDKYLEDHEDTHAMQISFDSAAYFCLQNKAHPKGPQLFGRKQ